MCKTNHEGLPQVLDHAVHHRPIKSWGVGGCCGCGPCGPCEVLKWRDPESLVMKELEVEPEYIVGVRGWSQRL